MVEPDPAVALVVALLGAGQVAQTATSGAAGLLGAGAFFPQLIGFQVQMGAQFVGEILRLALAAKHASTPFPAPARVRWRRPCDAIRRSPAPVVCGPPSSRCRTALSGCWRRCPTRRRSSPSLRGAAGPDTRLRGLPATL